MQFENRRTLETKLSRLYLRSAFPCAFTVINPGFRVLKAAPLTLYALDDVSYLSRTGGEYQRDTFIGVAVGVALLKLLSSVLHQLWYRR